VFGISFLFVVGATDILFWAVRVSGWLVLEAVATQWEVQAVSLSSDVME
jgi:hypothetical protein